MEVKIGVQHAPLELTVDTDESPETVEKMVAAAIEGSTALALVDSKGRRVVVPGDRIAYVEIGTGVMGTVGFRS